MTVDITADTDTTPAINALPRRRMIGKAAVAGASLVLCAPVGAQKPNTATPKPIGSPLWCGPASGSGNALSLNPPPGLTAYSSGLTLIFQASRTSKGGSLTVNAGGLGPKRLFCDRLIEGFVYQITYDGTRFRAVGSHSSFNVRLFGAVGDGLTDDTDALQAALDAAYASTFGGFGTMIGAIVDLPAGCYFTTRTLRVSKNVWLRGEGVNTSQIHRTGDFGDTIAVGEQTGVQAARISGIWFQHAHDYVNNTPLLESRATSGAHLHFFGAQWAIVENCWFNRMPYGIIFEGGSWQRVLNCQFVGVWDPDDPAMQEGIANVAFLKSPKYGQATSVVVSRCEFMGAFHNKTVNLSASDGSKSIPNYSWSIGPQHGVLMTGMEDCTITDNFFGGMSGSAIAIHSGFLDVRIANNMFDGMGHSGIHIRPERSDDTGLNLTITGNVFNGEFVARHAVHIEQNPQSQLLSVNAMTITGNTTNAYAATAMMISSAAGFTIASNTITNYNSHNVSQHDPEWINGIYVSGNTKFGAITGNVIGGGGNLFELNPSVNFCHAFVTVASSVRSVTVNNNVSVGLREG